MPVIRHADTRRTETPNAVMTTLASPTQGAASQAMWRVDMRPGQSGPLHAIDREQIWTALDGTAVIAVADQTYTLEPGDTAVIPADTPRRVSTPPTTSFTAVVAAPADMRAYVLDQTQAAPDGEKLIPAWVQ
jgi:quercetin dioxygenase-like cupin family protein